MSNTDNSHNNYPCHCCDNATDYYNKHWQQLDSDTSLKAFYAKAKEEYEFSLNNSDPIEHSAYRHFYPEDCEFAGFKDVESIPW